MPKNAVILILYTPPHFIAHVLKRKIKIMVAPACVECWVPSPFIWIQWIW